MAKERPLEPWKPGWVEQEKNRRRASREVAVVYCEESSEFRDKVSSLICEVLLNFIAIVTCNAGGEANEVVDVVVVGEGKVSSR